MHLSLATLGFLLLIDGASQVSAKFQGLSDAAVLAHLSNKGRRRAGHALNLGPYVQRRQQSSPAATGMTASSAPALSSTTTPTLGNSAGAACMQALTTLNGQASNPAGMAVCYNIVSFDNTTGQFQAIMGLYQVGPPTGRWVTAQQSSIDISMAYPGAMVASSNAVAKRSEDYSASPQISRYTARGELIERSHPPQILSQLQVIGQVDSSLMSQLTNQTAMKAALMPQVTLSGNAQDGTPITTTISNNEATFVNGLFSGATVQPAPAPSSVPAAGTVAPVAVQAQATPFVLPGTTLGIFPVGLIVTSVWAFFFIVAIGTGTVGRIKFRNAYRRRALRTNNNLTAGPRRMDTTMKTADYDRRNFTS